MSKRSQFFGLRYPDLKPIYFDRFGVEFQVVGAIFQGKNGHTLNLVLPDNKLSDNADFCHLSLSEWMDVLKYSDDPKYFETAPNGEIVKAIHRKCQRSIGQELQWKIYRRAGFRCEYCGEPRSLSIDHKIPVDLGGTDEESNLAAACKPCNRTKANMPWEDWMKIMKKRGWR